jgi:hypothetical protein
MGPKSTAAQEDDPVSQPGAEDGTVQSPDLRLQESKIMWVSLILLCQNMLFHQGIGRNQIMGNIE